MKRQYSIILGKFGKNQDRFAEYQPARPLEAMFEMAARVERCAGLELIYPGQFTDYDKLKGLLDRYHLRVSAVNLNIKQEKKWHYGTFSSPDANVRREALSYLKDAMDVAADLGCGMVTTAFLNDGADYPFELDYKRAFTDTAEGVREAARHRKDVKIALEYKASEPRAHCLLNNAGKTAFFCAQVNEPNVGITLDIGHALQAGEIPADSAAFLASCGKLFYLHVNDNYREWDWDMAPGFVNLWDHIEYLYFLRKAGYDGWFAADVVPQRYDPVKIMNKTFAWMDDLLDIAERIDEGKLDALIEAQDPFDALDYIRSLL